MKKYTLYIMYQKFHWGFGRSDKYTTNEYHFTVRHPFIHGFLPGEKEIPGFILQTQEINPNYRQQYEQLHLNI
jgi:hypothetical protein